VHWNKGKEKIQEEEVLIQAKIWGGLGNWRGSSLSKQGKRGIGHKITIFQSIENGKKKAEKKSTKKEF